MRKLKIEKLVDGGQGFSSEDGQVFFSWNALPDEDVEVEILNKRKGIYECLVTNVLKPSPYRITNAEEHFLSCSPWQIMDFDYENKMKIEIARETYERIGKIKDLNLQIETDGIQYGYRNKIEYSFITNEAGGVSFAFFHRGQRRKMAIPHCELSSKAINETAKKILDWANENKLTERNLKAVIIRSNQKGETIAGLFIKDRLELNCRDTKFCVSTENAKILGFSLYYSTHKSPASVITDTLYTEGQDFLIEEINGVKFKYGLNSFFQVNIPVFEKALDDIKSFIEEDDEVIDFYSGVGSIGLSLGAKELIESNEEAVDFAKENIGLNNVETHCNVSLSPAEKTVEFIEENKVIIFDPPRAGLHMKVIDRVLETKPRKIIYLSCNIATQARDLELLSSEYKIVFSKLYNFFPRTPHIEGLMVLERIKN